MTTNFSNETRFCIRKDKDFDLRFISRSFRSIFQLKMMDRIRNLYSIDCCFLMSFQIFHSIEDLVLLYHSNNGSRLLLGRVVVLRIHVAGRPSISVRIELHMVGELGRSHVGISSVWQVSVTSAFDKNNILWKLFYSQWIFNWRKINPVENIAVAVVAMGEGWHNYHVSFLDKTIE